MADPKTLRDHIRQHREVKEKRYEEYESLLNEAIQAGVKATEYRVNEPGPAKHGKVWLSLDDGRSSFARFVRARYPGLFTYGNRKTGTCYVVPTADFTAAVDYAIAFRDVLEAGGISVTVVSRPIEREN